MRTITLAAILLIAASPRVDVAALLAATPQLQRAASPSSDSNLPYYKIKGTTAEGFVNDKTIDDGFLANGQELLIVPLLSGGSGGVFYTLLWTRSGTERWRFVGYIPSKDGHMDAYIDEGVLVAVIPVYGPNDANCCASSHRYDRYTLDGIKLQLVKNP